MTIKYDGPGDDVTVVGRWEDGLTWMPHPDEGMQRASHALVDGGDVWLVDPFDAEGLDEELAALGTVAGVVVLTNSHGCHADRLADRHGVAVHVPACFDDPAGDFDAPVETFDDELADTGFELVWEKASSGWQEGILHRPGRETLVVADALGTSLFSAEDGQLVVFPLFRWSPPRAELGDLAVERVLVGHGELIDEGARAALDDALGVTRGGAVAGVARSVPTFARIAVMHLRG